jgi:hypothetical protein
MKTMWETWVIAGLILVLIVVFVEMRVKINNGREELALRDLNIASLKECLSDRQVKVEFMLRELNKVFEANHFSKKTWLSGVLNTLEWINTGEDEKFAGWVLAKKNINRRERKEAKNVTNTSGHNN